jgi:hypothetical protein
MNIEYPHEVCTMPWTLNPSKAITCDGVEILDIPILLSMVWI